MASSANAPAFRAAVRIEIAVVVTHVRGIIGISMNVAPVPANFVRASRTSVIMLTTSAHSRAKS
ncbi:hypothetical protein D3C72_2402840 [compost metagenome]